MSDQPWDFGTARATCRQAARAQETAEQELRTASREFAEKEERYRIALAKEIVRQHAAGVAWSAAADLARGDKEVARLRRERDIAEGVREAQQQAAWRRSADRKDAQRFADWSQRRDLAEGLDPTPDGPTFGSGLRAAA